MDTWLIIVIIIAAVVGALALFILLMCVCGGFEAIGWTSGGAGKKLKKKKDKNLVYIADKNYGSTVDNPNTISQADAAAAQAALPDQVIVKTQPGWNRLFVNPPEQQFAKYMNEQKAKGENPQIQIITRYTPNASSSATPRPDGSFNDDMEVPIGSPVNGRPISSVGDSTYQGMAMSENSAGWAGSAPTPSAPPAESSSNVMPSAPPAPGYNPDVRL
eukprot:gene1027-616_t